MRSLPEPISSIAISWISISKWRMSIFKCYHSPSVSQIKIQKLADLKTSGLDLLVISFHSLSDLLECH